MKAEGFALATRYPSHSTRYFGDSAIEPLSEVDCTFLAYSHLITFPPTEAPCITEAFSGGRIDLVTDQALTRALIEVEQHEDRLRTVFESINRTPAVLHRMFPGTISIIRATVPDQFPQDLAGTGYRTGATCDFVGREDDAAFLNDIARAASRNASYVALFRTHAERLDAIIAALDRPPT